MEYIILTVLNSKPCNDKITRVNSENLKMTEKQWQIK